MIPWVKKEPSKKVKKEPEQKPKDFKDLNLLKELEYRNKALNTLTKFEKDGIIYLYLFLEIKFNNDLTAKLKDFK